MQKENNPEHFILYGGKVSYYTGKARAFLRYKGIPYREVLASREVYKTIILPTVGYPVIPVVRTPEGEIIQDTSDIIDRLDARFLEASVFPSSPLQKLIALLFEVFGDHWLVLPAMHYRWNFKEQNFDYIIREFGSLNLPGESEAVHLKVGEKISHTFNGMLPMLGVNEKTIPGIEKFYLAFLQDFHHHLYQHPFLLGSRPSIGDFGLLGPLFAHLYRDPYPGLIMKSRAQKVADWVERMNEPEPGSGHFLEDDEIPETLLPIIRTIFKEMVPAMLECIRQTEAWLEAHPGQEIPRVIGTQAITIGGHTGEQMTQPFNQWMFQHPLEFYQSLEGEEKDRADRFLKEVDGYEPMQYRIKRRLKRKSYLLVPAE